MPKVSVLMPSFNYARYLPAAIQSVLSQSYSDLELIITDDCSTDESREIVEHFRRLDSRVIPVLHEVNSGLARARNSGLAISTGEFVALCDADDVWLPHKLETQIKCFQAQVELGIVHSDSAIIDAAGKLTGQQFSSLWHRRGQRTSGYLFEVLCEQNFLCVPTVVLRRQAIEYAGGFEENLRSLEDWVCWIKVSRKYPFHYVKEPLVQYRMHGSGLSSNPKGMAQNRVKAFRFLLDTFSDIPLRLRSKMLYSLGVSHLETGDFREAATAFLDSARANPLQIRSWVRCCQSMLG
jgi:cellulose synthase/poly-beta-1,6-N-acetylglucosamine synthase-like glycosyltransferase